jgi:hypothetical protein
VTGIYCDNVALVFLLKNEREFLRKENCNLTGVKKEHSIINGKSSPHPGFIL